MCVGLDYMKLRRLFLGGLFFLAVVVGVFFYLNPTAWWEIKAKYFTNRCTYPLGLECKTDDFCIFLNPKKSIFIKKDQGVIPEVHFPRLNKSRFICTQGPLSKKGRTHSYLNTAYAVDLSSPKGRLNADIIAVFTGVVITNTGCDNKDSSEFNNDYCGLGFGNWVVLFDQDSNLMAFYAHMRNIKVKDGQRVSVGEILGEEGKTGAAGHRHLHFSIHRNIWKLTLEQLRKHGLWLPPSIPWKTKIQDASGESRSVSVTELPCNENNNLTGQSFQGG